MSNENNIMVSVDMYEYQRLIEQDLKQSITIEALLSSAKLNYYKDGLTFDDALMSAVVKGLDPIGFKCKVEELQAAEAKEAE